MTDLEIACEECKKLFSLGRLGIPLTAIAVVYQVLAAINLLWPRSAVYDLTGHTWWLKWSGVLFIAITVVVNALEQDASGKSVSGVTGSLPSMARTPWPFK